MDQSDAEIIADVLARVTAMETINRVVLGQTLAMWPAEAVDNLAASITSPYRDRAVSDALPPLAKARANQAVLEHLEGLMQDIVATSAHYRNEIERQKRGR